MKMKDDYSYGKIGKARWCNDKKIISEKYGKAKKAKDKVDKMNEKQLYIFMMNLWKGSVNKLG